MNAGGGRSVIIGNSPGSSLREVKESPGGLLSDETAVADQERGHFQPSRNQSIALVFLCTVFGAAAQIFIKSGANTLTGASPVEMLLTPSVFFGYSLYGISTVLLIIALKNGELSILYPVISLTYVWVTMLSVAIFNESLNVFKVLGVLVIVLGVGVLGRKKSL